MVGKTEINICLVVVLSAYELVNGATNYITNPVHDNGESQQNVYSAVPQTYYVPQAQLQKYVTTSQKYVAPTANEIPIVIPKTVTSTEKSIIPSTYKYIDPSKYVASQIAKPTPIAYTGAQGSVPFVYSLAKVVPTTSASYTNIANIESNYYEDIPKKYHYGYRVSDAHTGAEFGHSEVNDGHVAKGYYHVLLPDGRLQNVKYYAGPSGYHATITYESKY